MGGVIYGPPTFFYFVDRPSVGVSHSTTSLDTENINKMSGKQEQEVFTATVAKGQQIIDLSDGGQMSAMPDYVLKHMPKKWHSKMCQACWRKESEVALCLPCVDDLMGQNESDSDTEAYVSEDEHGMSEEGENQYNYASAAAAHASLAGSK